MFTARYELNLSLIAVLFNKFWQSVAQAVGR